MADWPVPLKANGTIKDPHLIDLITARWPCPYCQRENRGGFPGRLAWVTQRVEDSDAKH